MPVYLKEYIQRGMMEITTKIIEEISIKIALNEESSAIHFLKTWGFTIINFDHREEYTKVIGHRIFKLTKKENTRSGT